MAGRAFVVHGERAPAASEGGIVHHRAELGRHLFADATGERAGALAVEVALETMPNRFVQQHARPAWAKHDGHRPGRGIHRLQVQQRGPHRFLGIVFRAGRVEQPSAVDATAATGETALAPAVALGNHRYVETRQRPHIGAQGSVRGHHQIGFVIQRDAHGDFLHVRIFAASEGVDAAQQFDLGVFVRASKRIVRRIANGAGGWGQGIGGTAAAAAGDASGGLGCVLQRGQADVVRVGETGFFAADGTNANATVDAEHAVLYRAILQRPGLEARYLEVQFANVDVLAGKPTELANHIGFAELASIPERLAGGVYRVVVHLPILARKSRCEQTCFPNMFHTSKSDVSMP